MAESQDDISPLDKSESDTEVESRAEKQNETTSDGAPVAPPSEVVDLCKQAFLKTAQYLRGELDAEKQNETTSDGAPVAPPSEVVDLCKQAFLKTAQYLRGELDGTIEDYRLLEKMNQLTTTKYSEMKHIALSISSALKELNNKYKSLQPYLEQIDQIEESVTTLEQIAYSLDQYSKSLENKFKALEKR